MNTTMLKRVRKLFNNADVSPSINRAYQRKWVRAVRQLGPNWKLSPANYVKREGVSHAHQLFEGSVRERAPACGE